MSKNNILYISDFFLSDLIGGGELNDYELCSLLLVNKLKSHEVTTEVLKKYMGHKIIVSNFVNLPVGTRDLLADNFDYVIYEHDHKYLRNRNPAKFKDFIAPKSQIVNAKFYQNAMAVFCQSSFHKSIIEKNLSINNVHNLSGNLWSEDSLSILEILSKKEKNNRYSILNSGTWHKNTSETCFYCEKKGYEYELISSKNYNEFLSLMSNNNKFIFLPKSPETLSRVVVEARMMGIKTITNKNVGASYEPWFKLSGCELIEHMRGKRVEIPNRVLEILNG